MRIIMLLISIFMIDITNAGEQIYVREYMYQAGEADSKITSRVIASEEVKRLLLEELGTHISSLMKIQSDSKGAILAEQEVQSLTAGITKIEILEEKWNGAEYYLKARMVADPDDVLGKLKQLVDAEEKKKRIQFLDVRNKKLETENIQVSAELKRSKLESDELLMELKKIKVELANTKIEGRKNELEKQYQITARQLEKAGLSGTGFYYFLRRFKYEVQRLT